MIPGRPGRYPGVARPAVLAAALAAAASLAACSGSAGRPSEATVASASGATAPTAAGSPRAAARGDAAPATPTSAQQLGALVVDRVPSGLPRIPDGDLQPPAGPKDVAAVASYADDPEREREVLHRYGFRYGWERFWGRGDWPVTSVFLDQFLTVDGAAAFTGDLAGNDAEHYHATLHEHPAQLPAGCRLLTVDRAEPEVDLRGPTAFAWCAAGVYSVAVSSGSGTVGAAVGEVVALVHQQLARLPEG